MTSLILPMVSSLIADEAGASYFIHPDEVHFFDFTEASKVAGEYTDKVGSFSMYLGNSAPGDGAEPTFSTDHLSFDGGDRLEQKTAYNDFFNSLTHGGSEYSIVYAMKVPATGNSIMGLMATDNQNASGIYFNIRTNSSLSSRQLQFMMNSSYSFTGSISEFDNSERDVLIIASVQVSESAFPSNTLNYYVNGTKYVGSSFGAGAPTGGNPSQSMLFGARYNLSGSVLYPLENGSELHAVGFINKAVSDSEAAEIKTNIEAITGRTY